ncbi:MAG: ATP-binding protein [bacterium]
MCAHKYPGPHHLGQNQLTDPRVDRAVAYLIVGLPGAGKTTHAKELETSESAPRLTPDEWQISLFGHQNPPDKRDLMEGKLVQLGLRAAQLGINVVFDFGFWGKDERSALRWIAGTVGARGQVVYLPIDHEEQRRRVTNRFATTPDQTFHMSDVELEQWRTRFQAPDDEELQGSENSTGSTRARDMVAVGISALAILARSIRPHRQIGLGSTS